jgi:hypothetical protein
VKILPRPDTSLLNGRVLVVQKNKESPLAVLCIMFAFIGAIEKLSIEKLNSNHSEDKLKEDVDYEDVEDILERNDNTVEHSFQFWNTIDCLQRSEYTQELDCFELLSG